jgi:hypothetical protein
MEKWKRMTWTDMDMDGHGNEGNSICWATKCCWKTTPKIPPNQLLYSCIGLKTTRHWKKRKIRMEEEENVTLLRRPMTP